MAAVPQQPPVKKIDVGDPKRAGLASGLELGRAQDRRTDDEMVIDPMPGRADFGDDAANDEDEIARQDALQSPRVQNVSQRYDVHLADEYLRDRVAAAGQGPVMQALRRQMAGENDPSSHTGKPDAEASAPEDASPPAPGPASPEPSPAAAAGAERPGSRAGEAGQPADLRSRLVERMRESTAQRNWLDFGDRVLGMGKAVVGDVVGGVTGEGAPQVFKGMNKALENFFASADDLGNWLNANVADLRLNKAAPEEDNPLRHLSDAARDFQRAVPEAGTVTGKAVQGVAQWMTGNALIGKIATALGVPMSTATRLIKDMATGATAFDPKADRLSNTLDNVAPNPLTEWLKAKPEDSAAEGRLKNALEIGGLGALADGVVYGFKTLRAWRGAQADLPSGSGGTAADALKAGDATGGVSAEMRAKAKDFLDGAIPDVEGPINLARIQGPEDVKSAIDKLARQLPAATPESLQEVARGARELGMTPEQLIAGVQGGALDARQITAARTIMRSAAGQLQALAVKATGLDGSAQDMAAFNKAFALNYGIVKQVHGSSAEIARALGAHRLMAESEPAAVKALQQLIEQSGGAEASRDMALKIAALDDPAKVAELVGEIAKGTTRDNLAYAYMNLLVSNPASHVANISGNGAAAAIDVWERWLAGQIDSGARRLGFDPGQGVAEGEALAKLYGMRRGTWDGLTAAGRTLRTGVQDFGMAKEMATGTPLGAGMEGDSNSWLKMLLPARWLGAEDQVFKWMHYRGELAALAMRDAQSQGLSGEAIWRHIDDVLDHPPSGMHEAAADAAKRLTFNAQAGAFMQKIQSGLRDLTFEVRPGLEIPIGKTLVMPFTSTPYNIARWNIERTPMLGLVLRDMRADLAAGGARMELALAKQATGVAIAGTVWELVQQGRVTGGGPQDAELRGNLTRQGWQAYSWRLGDRYFGFDRFDTPGQLVGAVADVADVLTWAKDEDRQDMATAITMAFSRAIMSRTYLSGLAGIVNAMSDPERYGDSYVDRAVTSPIPTVAGTLAQAIDPVRRDVRPGDHHDALADEIREIGNAIRAKTPGLSVHLPPRTDLFGNDVPVAGAYLGIPGTGIEMQPQWARLLSPVKVSDIKDSPIDAEMTRLRLKIKSVGETMPWPGLKQGVPLEPREQYRYAKLQGQEVADPRTGLNLEQTLNAMVRGEGAQGELYARLPDDGKALMIQSQIQDFRGRARLELVKEFPEIKEAIDSALEDLKQAARPDGGGVAAPAAGPTMAPDNTRASRAPVRVQAPKLD